MFLRCADLAFLERIERKEISGDNETSANRHFSKRVLKVLNREELVNIVKEKGLEWAIASMVDGSIGYYSPSNARQTIEQLVSGQRLWVCERTSACFKGDALAEIDRDFFCFIETEKRNPEKVKRIIEFCKAQMNLSTIEQWSLSSVYPTMNI